MKTLHPKVHGGILAKRGVPPIELILSRTSLPSIWWW